MSGNYLLDTSVVIDFLEGDHALTDHVDQAEAIFVSCVTLGELYVGARKSAKAAENLARVEQYALESTILDANLDTARLYGRIKNELRLRGQPIPENDIWIAAVAVQHNLILVTRDAHFSRISDLLTDGW
jgi:tRNA(fMet)-specific endonuclease VapC